MSDIRAHVEVDFARAGVAVTVYRRTEQATHLFQPADNGALMFTPWVEIDPHAIAPGPSYRLPDEVAKALLEALLDYYRGGHDARQLRKDYEHERIRVDKLIDRLLAGRDG